MLSLNNINKMSSVFNKMMNLSYTTVKEEF